MPAATPKREAVRDWRLERAFYLGQDGGSLADRSEFGAGSD